MSIKVLVFGMTDNPGGMESCVMNYYRNIDWSDVQFDFLCNWENMVYADEVTAKGTNTQYHRKAKTIKHIRKHLMISLKHIKVNMMYSGIILVH